MAKKKKTTKKVEKTAKELETITARVKKKTKRASELQDPYRILVYGRPKKGKTRLMATLPQVLLIDVNEKGTRSTKQDLNPLVYPVEEISELDDIYWFLARGDHEFQSYAIDSITALQTLAVRFVLKEDPLRDITRDPNMPSKQTWGKANDLVKDIITKYRNLPMHGGFTALERSRDAGDDEEEEGMIVIGPAVSPGVATHLEAAVGTIGRLTAREVRVKKGKKHITVVRRELFIGMSDRIIAGDRDHIWGSTIRNPHLGKMLEQLEGGQ